MTATVDLLLLKEYETLYGVVDGFYEPWRLIANYTDTSGISDQVPVLDEETGRETFKWVHQTTGKAAIIEALFGDGPERHGFTSARPIVLAGFDHSKRKPCRFSTRKYRKNRYVIWRSRITEVVYSTHDREEQFVRGFALSEFTAFLQSIPLSDMESCRDSTVPLNAFLMALDPQGCIVVPIIGGGISGDIPSLWALCGHSGSILDARHIV